MPPPLPPRLYPPTVPANAPVSAVTSSYLYRWHNWHSYNDFTATGLWADCKDTMTSQSYCHLRSCLNGTQVRERMSKKVSRFPPLCGTQPLRNIHTYIHTHIHKHTYTHKHRYTHTYTHSIFPREKPYQSEYGATDGWGGMPNGKVTPTLQHLMADESQGLL